MDVHIPKMGMSTVEVTILEVLVAPGVSVRPGDGLVVIEGDKASFQIDAEIEGVVQEVLVAVGDEREVGDVAVRIRPVSD
jgi:pyruvate/2-oxoglutarate dehydrogenase complex dihydrolipoamide acyltransferase (E2) component